MSCEDKDVDILKSSHKDSVILSSPYFDRNDDKFTEFIHSTSKYSDISCNLSDDRKITIKLDESGDLSEISFGGNIVSPLEISDFYVHRNVLVLRKNDGQEIRLLSSKLDQYELERLSRELSDLVNTDSLNVISTKWGTISGSG